MEPRIPKDEKTNIYHLEHYMFLHFGDLPLRRLDTFGIQVWLNGMVDKEYSQATVRLCFTNTL
jgi:hypothetical protein